MKKRLEELDWLRAAAMTAVVLLHASSTFVARPSRLCLWGVTPALLLNQASRFSVPGFFLLSGLSLELSSPPRLPGFWLRRLRRVGLPYLGWTVFYFLAARGVSPALPLPDALSALGRDLALGSAAPHLWFIPVLLQLYLLYPLLRLLCARRPRAFAAVCLLLSLGSTLAVLGMLPVPGRWRSWLWRLFFPWLGYFALGMSLGGEGLERLAAFCRRHGPGLALAGLLGAMLYSLDAAHSGNLESVKPQLFVYTPLALAALLGVWSLLRPLPWAAKSAGFLARRSMGVYFVHVFLLRLLRRIPFLTKNAPGMLVLAALTFLGSLLLCSLPGLLLGGLRRLRKL